MESKIIVLIYQLLNDIRLFLFPNEISIAINSMIFCLLLLTYVVSRSTIRRYNKHEEYALYTVRQKVDEKISRVRITMESGDYEEKKEGSKPGESVDNDNTRKEKLPDLLMDINKLREGVNETSIIYKRLDFIERMRKVRVKIDADFLQQATLTAEASRLGNTLPRFSSNFALILGLFGTFIGLALMVTKISMLLPNPSTLTFSISGLQSSIAGMETVFKGIKTAFSTSIVGIFATLVCLYLSFRIYRNQTTFFHNLEIFTVEKLLPVTVPPVQSEHPLENIAFQLQDSFDDLELIISHNKKTIENLSTIQGSFKTIVDEVRDITQREASRNFEGVLALLTKTNESITGIVQQWPKSVQAMKEYTKLTGMKIDSLINVMQKQQETFDAQINRIMRVREGGGVINVPTLNRYAIVAASLIVLLAVLLVAC